MTRQFSLLTGRKLDWILEPSLIRSVKVPTNPDHFLTMKLSHISFLSSVRPQCFNSLYIIIIIFESWTNNFPSKEDYGAD